MANPLDKDVPPAPDQYLKWLQRNFRKAPGVREGRVYYESVATSLKGQVEESLFWRTLMDRLENFAASYFIDTGLNLFAFPHSGDVVVKPWPSFVTKAYRVNVSNNPRFPEPPPGNWLLPDEYFTRVRDVVRTTFVVKYLDGVHEFARQIEELADEVGNAHSYELKGTIAGYYAGHVEVSIPASVMTVGWRSIGIEVPLEIQVTTQVKEVIKELLHRTYVQVRTGGPEDLSWLWDYESRPFAANYLGHILQYVEGRIMDVRRMDEAGQSDD